jgi:hypothetical protein
MHFHLPKPLHGWREFAGEVGIIVIGVIIAIGIEQFVQAIHWRNEVSNSRVAIADDIERNNRAFAFRLAAHDCIADRLVTLKSDY